MVEPHRTFVIPLPVRIFELRLNLLELPQLFFGDGGSRPRRQLSADVRLDAGHVGDVAARHRQHHETAVGLLDQQALGAQSEQRLTNRCDADPQLGGQLFEPDIIACTVGPFEDAPADVPRDVLARVACRAT